MLQLLTFGFLNVSDVGALTLAQPGRPPYPTGCPFAASMAACASAFDIGSTLPLQPSEDEPQSEPGSTFCNNACTDRCARLCATDSRVRLMPGVQSRELQAP